MAVKVFVSEDYEVKQTVERIETSITQARVYLATAQVISVINAAHGKKDKQQARSLKKQLKHTLEQKQNKHVRLPKAIQQYYDEADFGVDN